MEKISTAKGWRSFEAVFEIGAQLAGIYLVYTALNWTGQHMFGTDFRQDTLLSLLLLPAIYILRDLLIIFEPFFVVVEKSESKVSVRSGITPRVVDTLELKSVDNIEVVKTPIGYLLNYGTIRLYGRGGSVEMPFVYDAESISKTINIGEK